MKRAKKIGWVLVIIFALWAIINPFIFQFTASDADTKAAFSAKGMSIKLEDFKFEKNNLHYSRIGDTTKPVLLFVHGSPGCWDFAWQYYMDSSWHKNYELISIDRPGFGNSDYGQAKNLFEQSRIISAFVRDKLAGRNVQLIGHSYGGPLVLQLCADNDSLYQRCFVLAGSVSPEAEKEELQLTIFSHPLLNWIAPGSFQQGILELLWLKEDLKTYESGLSKIRTPIIAIYGTADNMVPYEENVRFLKQHFDSTQLNLESMKGASHFLPWENYDEVRDIIIWNNRQK